MIKNLKPVTQDWGKKIEETQHLTSAEASAVPRAAQQALCRAGSQELLRGQAAVRPPLRRHPLISPTARGPASCIPECLLQERLLRSRSLAPLNRQGSWNHERPSQHGQTRTSIWATVLAWWDHNPQHHHSFCFCSFSRKSTGKTSSLLWRGSTSCQNRVSSKAPGWSGIWTVQAGDGGPLSHKDFFIL